MSRSTKKPYSRSSTDGKRKTHDWKRSYNRAMRRKCSPYILMSSDCEEIAFPLRAEDVNIGDVWSGPRDGQQRHPGTYGFDDERMVRLRRK